MKEDHQLRPDTGEKCIALTRDYRLLQKVRGHRYSVDDMLVAHLACTQGCTPRRVLDLGCGLGSVLLIMAWRFPSAAFVGVEALAEHVALAGRNLRLNACQDRARVVAGDLRDSALMESQGAFDLITGSPPYFAPESGTHCADPARAAAHFELRGGIEQYAEAAARSLSPGGLFVGCAGAVPRTRAREALVSHGLQLRFYQPVLPRAGKEPFLVLFVCAKETAAETTEAPPLVLRDEEGRRTAEHLAIRRWTGVSRRPARAG